MSGEWDGLRAAAEAATVGPWRWSGGMDSRAIVLAADPTFKAQVDGHSDAAYIAAANPAVVLALLDRLAAAEAAVERVRAIFSRGELQCGRFGLTCEQADLERYLWCHPCCLSDALSGTQDATGADLSASGAESDHGGRRDGEGLA